MAIVATPVAPPMRPSVCPSVTLMHPPKTVGRNDMPFGKDTCVVPSNIRVTQDPGLTTGRGDLKVGNPVRSHAAYRLITLALVQDKNYN